jgi:hypothetical protein
MQAIKGISHFCIFDFGQGRAHYRRAAHVVHEKQKIALFQYLGPRLGFFKAEPKRNRRLGGIPPFLGRKASDEFTVPLCRMHHREVHRAGDESAWWKAAGIDPLKVARKFWGETRVNDGRIAATDNQSVKAADVGHMSQSPDPSGRAPA